jgi:polyribonucleotide 5'-hydroxyl-kinase
MSTDAKSEASGSGDVQDRSETFELSTESELRIEVGKSELLKLTVVRGTAELFGTELLVEKEYTFHNAKFGLFSWHGAVVTLKGSWTLAYVAKDTPMVGYISTHATIERMRSAAEHKKVAGPRVMVVGPTDVGKSTLSRILVNYALRQGRTMFYVDIDVGQNGIAPPGSVAACVMEEPVGPEVLPCMDASSPLLYFYGHPSPSTAPELYMKYVENLAAAMDKRAEQDPSLHASGSVINTCGWVTEGGYELLVRAAGALKADMLIVLGDDRLCAKLAQDSKITANNMQVVKLGKSGGVVNRDAPLRRSARQRAVQRYFYGQDKRLKPHQMVVPFHSIIVYRIGGNQMAPSSTLPLGADRLIDPNQPNVVTIGASMQSALLAVTYASEPHELTSMKGNVAGFVFVQSVDSKAKTITLLCPSRAELPCAYLLLGSVKWSESSS